MKKPIITMLKKGSKIKAGDIVVRDEGVMVIKENDTLAGFFVHGPNTCYCTEGFYFRITWKEVDNKCIKN